MYIYKRSGRESCFEQRCPSTANLTVLMLTNTGYNMFVVVPIHTLDLCNPQCFLNRSLSFTHVLV